MLHAISCCIPSSCCTCDHSGAPCEARRASALFSSRLSLLHSSSAHCSGLLSQHLQTKHKFSEFQWSNQLARINNHYSVIANYIGTSDCTVQKLHCTTCPLYSSTVQLVPCTEVPLYSLFLVQRFHCTACPLYRGSTVQLVPCTEELVPCTETPLYCCTSYSSSC